MDKPQLPKILIKFHLYLLLLSSLIGFGSHAQTYPITVSTQIMQPSPIYLSNYADASTVNSPIKIQLVLNDLTISNRQVKLKIYFQGNGISFSTNDYVVGARPLYLEGGFPLQLTNVDLAPYFEYQNLLGLTSNQYAKPLPEGAYNIYVEVYDFATGKKLSKKTGTTTIIFQNEPPILNLPLNNTAFMQQNIQNIVFSWTPRSINVSNVEYEFSLVEIWDKNTPIQNAFAYSPPLFTTTTRATTLQYSITEAQLLPGKKYAWRIKAKALLGAEEIGVFKNNGYSEIFAFNYDTFCTAPLAITTSGISENQAKITWSGSTENYDYQINYREKNADSEWYNLVTPRENATISNLKPNTTYEYSVGASCDVGRYTHSNIYEFTTLARDEIAFQGCGIKPDPNDLANKTPLPELFPNDVVTAGDFPIVVLHSTGSNGTFSGDGYVTLPFLEKFRKLIDTADALGGHKVNIGQFSRIRITFNNIGVNTDFKLISGEIIASYDAEWKGMADGDKILNTVLGSDGKPIEGSLAYEVKSAVLNPDGSTTITGTNGESTTLPKSVYDQVYIDKNGNAVNIPANGSAAPTISKPAEGGKAVAANTNGMSSSGEVIQISSPDVTITFSDAPKALYAFDKLPDSGSEQLKAAYETLQTKDGGVYKVNYKAVSDLSGPDSIIAEAQFKNGKTKDDIVFKTNTGTAVDFEWKTATKAEIKIKKTLNFAKESIIATVKGAKEKDPKDASKTIDGKSDIAGKVNVWQLTQKPVINITLLSVNNAKIPSSDEAKKYLNEVYNKVGIKFDVTSQNVTINTLPSIIGCGDSGIINYYSDDQIAIKNQIESNPDFTYNSETYYIIYTGKSGQNGYNGFMPLGGQYAFIFDNNLRTAAHELGHGIFGLKHPFTTESEQGKTDLLMDYGTGTVLSHNDWDTIHSGGWKFYGFQKSSSGALAGGYGISPDWEFVQTQLASSYTGSYVADEGFTSGFLDLYEKESVKYVWDPKLHKYFYTHVVNGEERKEEHAITTKITGNPWIWLFANNKGECNVDKKYIRTKYQYIESFKAAGNTVGLQDYIKKILADPTKKEKDKDSRDQVWGILACASSSGSGKGLDISYDNYIVNLGKNANKGYRDDEVNVNAQENHVYDYADVISEKEKIKILSQMGAIKTDTNIATKIFLTDSKTPTSKRKEVTDYLDKLSGLEIALWVDFDSTGKATIQTYLGDKIEGKGTAQMDKYLSVLAKIVPDFEGKYTYFNPFAAMLDGIAGLIGKSAIPEKYYNPDTKDYNQLPSKVFAYVTLAVTAEISNKDQYRPSRQEFALVCGAWNGLAGTVEAVPSGISMLLKLRDSAIDVIVNHNGTRDKLIKTLSNINKEQISELYNTLEKEVTKGYEHYTSNPCMVAYSSGQAAFVIASLFIGAGEANAAKTFLQTLEKLDVAGHAIGEIFKIGGKFIKPILNATGKGFKFVLREGVEFIRDTKLIIKPSFNLFCGFPILDIKLIRKGAQFTEDEIKALKSKVDEAINAEGGIEKIPLDENGNRIIEIDVNGEKTPVILGTEESLDKIKAEPEPADAIKTNKLIVADPFDEAGKLRPNVRYKAGEFDYWGETDELGRLESMSATDLKLTEREKRLIHDANTPGKDLGDHAGHLIADRFGGSKEIDNIVSQLQEVNLSTYKKIENEWARALSAVPPLKVEANIKVLYEGTDLRPSSFEIEYKIDGELKTVKISNIK